MMTTVDFMLPKVEMTFCDPWLEKKFKLFKLLYKLGLKKNCGASGYSRGGKGVYTYVW